MRVIGRDVARVAARKAIRVCAASVALLLIPLVPARAQTPSKSQPNPAQKSSPGASASKPSEAELTRLSHALRDTPSDANYAKLSTFAKRNAKNELGERAALALGCYDFNRKEFESALTWLEKADGEELLHEYVSYWHAQTLISLDRKAEALDEMEKFRRDYPTSVMSEDSVTSLAQAALDLGKPEDAAAALDAYPATTSKPALLLLRAQAREKLAQARSEKPLAAATDYLDVYYRFPLSDEAKAAGDKIPWIKLALGESFPGTPLLTQLARAEALYQAHRWPDARAAYSDLLANVSGHDHELAALRVAECDVQTGGKPDLLISLPLTDPDLDAERLYAISQAHWSQTYEGDMLEDVEELVRKYPQSTWTADALFATGNFYVVIQDRDRAASYYRRMLDSFPDSKNAQGATWRIAWTAYLERKPEAGTLLESYVRKYPTAAYIPDALFWLGRFYEHGGNVAHARSFYLTAAYKFPLTYFGAKAAARIRPAPAGIGSSPVNPAEFLSVIPKAAPLPDLDPAPARPSDEREMRARALSSIGLDASAELEYRAAFNATRSLRLLFEMAKSASAAGHYPVGMVAARQVYPQLEARRIAEVPLVAWRTAFPLPYEPALRKAASENKVDPMLVAGLIRQESAFDANVVSYAGAVGLMQVLPKTGPVLARRLHVYYSNDQLTDPDYNLRLGTLYLSDLLGMFGVPEEALAAYNAGEDRVVSWTSKQKYEDITEFVESIPFTQTREYVQIVLRNADVYRQIYGPAPKQSSRKPQRKAKR